MSTSPTYNHTMCSYMHDEKEENEKDKREKTFICHFYHIEGTFFLFQARSLLEDILHLPLPFLLYEILPYTNNLNVRRTLANFP